MAEQRWQQEIANLQTRLEVLAQHYIQAWHQERERLLQRTARRFEHVGVDTTHHWQGMGQPLREVRTQKDLEGITADFQQAVAMTKDDREWRDVEQTPAYQAWERERNLPIHEPDADELGWQEEQRFYAEQDPTSQWYREDLYHGEPGPDVAIDRAEQEMRQRDEVEFERQELAYDESQLRIAAGEPRSMGDFGNWEHPFEFPTEAEQQAYEDRPYDLMEERTHGGEEMERSLPYDTIVVDTSNPTMEEDFQALLARIDQRLDALVRETEPETQQLQQKQGVRY